MALKKFKPITAGTRWRIGNAYAEVTTNIPEKSLVESMSNTGGRNAQGRRSMRYIGGGHKQKYRIVDFKRNKHEVPAKAKARNTKSGVITGFKPSKKKAVVKVAEGEEINLYGEI